MKRTGHILKGALPLFLFLFLGNIVNAQKDGSDLEPKTPQIIPNSPEASKFQEYGKIPVNYSSGTVNFSIPVYTIHIKDLDIPISLNYLSKGIKVNEVASSEGLGWVLSYGGSITQQVYDQPDDLTNMGYDFPTDIANFDPSYDPNNSYETTQNYDYRYALNKAENPYNSDTAPDIFDYSIAGRSGKFFFTNEGDIKQIPTSPSKITKTTDGIEIVNENGVVFNFNVHQFNITSSNCTRVTKPAISSIDSQMLLPSHIQNSKGETVDYTYENYDYQFHSGITQTDYQNKTGYGCQEIPFKECDNITTVHGKRLKNIMVNNSIEIVFEYDVTPRTDIYNPPGKNYVNNRLKKIVIKNQLSNTTVHEFSLFHSYFKTSPTFYSTDAQVTAKNIRLKLDSIVESDKVTAFEYYSPEDIAARLSKSQDYWGYYNGKSNATLIPVNIAIGSGDADRSTVLNFLQRGALKKVVYPTKGSTLFEYEPQKIKVLECDDTQTRTSILQVERNNNSSTYSYSGNITLADNSFFDSDVSSEYFRNQVIIDGPVTFNLQAGESVRNGILPAGTYSIFINGQGYDGAYLDIFTVDQGTSCNTVEKVVYGGLRIHSFSNYTQNGDLAQSKSLVYENAGTSSGSENYFFRNYNINFLDADDNLKICDYYYLSSHPLHSLSEPVYGTVKETEEGNGRTTYYFSKGINDLEEGSSIIQPGLIDDNFVWSKGLLLKKLIEKWDANSQSYLTVKQVENNYLVQYDNDANSNAPNEFNYFGLDIKLLRTENVNRYYQVFPAEFDPGKLTYISCWFYKNKSTTTDNFYNNGMLQHQLIDETTYQYENPVHQQVTHIVEHSNDDKIVDSQLYYPDDVTGVSSLGYDSLTNSEYNAIGRLKTGDQHRIATVVQRITQKESGGLSLSKTAKRTNFTDIANLVLPGVIQTSKLANGMEDRIEFLRYDSKGNPLEVFKTEGPHIVYIWGYDYQYPIAKIENATYSQVVSALGESTLDGYDESNLSAINGLRSNASLIGALITTYTYIPLVGVSTITDPKGMVTTYSYDSFNRLQYIKDPNGKLLKEYTYHYKGQ